MVCLITQLLQVRFPSFEKFIRHLNTQTINLRPAFFGGVNNTTQPTRTSHVYRCFKLRQSNIFQPCQLRFIRVQQSCYTLISSLNLRVNKHVHGSQSSVNFTHPCLCFTSSRTSWRCGTQQNPHVLNVFSKDIARGVIPSFKNLRLVKHNAKLILQSISMFSKFGCFNTQTLISIINIFSSFCVTTLNSSLSCNNHILCLVTSDNLFGSTQCDLNRISSSKNFFSLLSLYDSCVLSLGYTALTPRQFLQFFLSGRRHINLCYELVDFIFFCCPCQS